MIAGDYWIGFSATLFAENSQRKVSRKQVERLMDSSLSRPKFQALYSKFTAQKETVRGFGLELPHPKLMK